MSADLQLPISALADWIRSTDSHAPARLAVLGRAERILAGNEAATAEQRRDVAERLERWRYQHLNERSGRLRACENTGTGPEHLCANCGKTAPGEAPVPGLSRSFGSEDRQLADWLDLAANRLAGRRARPPRWPRAAVYDHEGGDAQVETIDRCLDHRFPLDDLRRLAGELTAKHFACGAGVSPAMTAPTAAGTAAPQCRRRMLLYAPLYLSSHCINHCIYCGFRYPHQIERRHLDFEEAMQQAEILLGRGFRHILVVGGDFPSLTTTEYYARILRGLTARGIRPAVEIAAQAIGSYAELAAAGACGVTLYQETYNERLYALYHPRGSKTSYDWRLEGPERAAEAGIGRLGLGFLVGLADPREDLVAMTRHAAYLHARFPECTLAFSLPRIREAPQGFVTPYPTGDETFIRMYCALRLAFPRAELVLSTRELPELRNRLAKICITQLSAGSSTSPGGYGDDAADHPAGQQFPVCDRRSVDEMVQWLRGEGFEVAWEA
jgi:2-iminoacetate synthase